MAAKQLKHWNVNIQAIGSSEQTVKPARSCPVRLAPPVRHRLRLGRMPSGLGRRAGLAVAGGYLAPYVFKVAITNRRIVSVEDHVVTIRYKKGKSSRWRSTRLDASEFIRRFLQHVLPTGFMKVRYYGFMDPSSSVTLQEIAARIKLAYGFAVKTPESDIEPTKPLYCPCCGGKLEYKYSILPFQLCLLSDTG